MTTDAPALPVGTDFWRGFRGQHWRQAVDVRDFIRANVSPHTGGASFLVGSTLRTQALRELVNDLLSADAFAAPAVDVAHASGIVEHEPGHVASDLEILVGLQTDAPLRRAVYPQVGLRSIDAALAERPEQLAPALRDVFTRHRRTVSDGVQDAWTPEMLRAARAGLLLGVPTAIGRGSVVGDYRRVALYGVDRLIEQKLHEKHFLDALSSTEAIVRDRIELAAQVRALGELKQMAAAYGADIARPAATAREAVQWLYLAYLAAVKQSNAHVMPLGRTSTFLDVYVERDLAEGLLDEAGAQELFDDLVLRLRLVRQLRSAVDRALLGGAQLLITETVGGLTEEGRPLVTRTSLRMLQSLRNVGGGGQPRLAVLWSPDLPDAFRHLAVDVALETGDVEFVDDDLVRPRFGDDATAVTGGRMVRTGKHIVLDGGEVNLAKAVLYAVTGGRDDVTGEQVAPARAPLEGPELLPGELMPALERVLDWVAETHVNAVDVVHAAHDAAAYESLAMALHDYGVLRTVACRVAGLASAANTVAAADVGALAVRHDGNGRVCGLTRTSDAPAYGDGGASGVKAARWLVESLLASLRRHPAYRNGVHTLGTGGCITGAAHGRNTGATPDGRAEGDPLAPGATPRSWSDVIDAAEAVAGLPYECCLDGVTLTVSPDDLGGDRAERADRLVALLDEWGGCCLCVTRPDAVSGSVEA